MKQGISEDSDSDYENKGHKSYYSSCSSRRVKEKTTKFSPVESPQGPLTMDSPPLPKPDLHCRKEPESSLLRLMSNRKKDNAASDSSISSSDSDNETRVHISIT